MLIPSGNYRFWLETMEYDQKLWRFQMKTMDSDTKPLILTGNQTYSIWKLCRFQLETMESHCKLKIPNGNHGFWFKTISSKWKPCRLIWKLNLYLCCCQCSHYYCILISHINKLKKWLFYIYLLTTITKALYQPSEKGMSLLFTCPQLTVESSLLAAAARMLLYIM